MRTVKENRYNNLLLLIDEAGSMGRLEEKTGITANYLRQIKNKNIIQNGKPKGIGDKIATKLEDGMGKPRGWLDQDHSNGNTLKENNLIYLKENITFLMKRKNIPNLATIANRIGMSEKQFDEFLNEPDLSKAEILSALSNVFFIPQERLFYELLQTNPKGINLLKWQTSPEIAIQDTPDLEHQHRIDYLDVRMAAGMRNFENADYPEIIKSLWLSDDGMLELVGKRSSDGIYLVNVPTDSMEPTILKGDIVFIDTRINHYNGDGIYAFSINGNLFVKRFQKLVKGGYKIISDNTKYAPEEMTDNEVDTTMFVGKFIRCWRIDSVDL